MSVKLECCDCGAVRVFETGEDAPVALNAKNCPTCIAKAAKGKRERKPRSASKYLLVSLEADKGDAPHDIVAGVLLRVQAIGSAIKPLREKSKAAVDGVTMYTVCIRETLTVKTERKVTVRRG